MLENAGVIEGSRAILDRAAIGLSLTIFSGIRVERHSHAYADAFVEAVLAIVRWSPAILFQETTTFCLK